MGLSLRIGASVRRLRVDSSGDEYTEYLQVSAIRRMPSYITLCATRQACENTSNPVTLSSEIALSQNRKGNAFATLKCPCNAAAKVLPLDFEFDQ
jgi:hypothetical protein